MTVLLGLAERLRSARLFVVADAARLGMGVEAFARACFAGGAQLLQLDVAGLPRAQALQLLDELRTVGQSSQAIVVVGDLPLAQEFQADGVLLAQASIGVEAARRGLSPWALIGRECRGSLEFGLALDDPQLAFATLGPAAADGVVNAELVHQGAVACPPAGSGALPWFAAGGVTLDNIEDVVAAGATRVVVGKAIGDAADPAAACAAFRRVLDERWRCEDLQTYLDRAQA